MGLKLNGATSGSIEIDVPAVAGTDTAITIPATTGGEFIVSDSSGNIDLGPLDINGGAADNSVNIDGSGRLLVGTSSSSTYGSHTAQLQISGSNENTSSLSLHRSNGSPYLTLNTGATSGTAGNIHFNGYDGTSAYNTLAAIAGVWDGTGGVGDGPGRLVFSTTADGASSPTERVRIQADGKTKFSGSVYGNETTITASDFDLNDGNFFTCGAIAIPNPTNGVAGMSGLIRVTAAPTSFGSNWDFPGGSYTAPTTFPAVAPFYIVSSTQFYLGNWTEGIA